MSRRERMLTLEDGTRLQLYTWTPVRPAPVRGVMVIIHGFGEHAGRYAHWAEAFVRLGFAVYLYEQRGHGRTPGRRGVGSYDAMLEDVHYVRLQASQEHPGLPLVLYGHSMGGNFLLNYLLDYDVTDVACAVVESPWLDLARPLPPIGAWFVDLLGRLLPRLTFRTRLDGKALSRDRAFLHGMEGHEYSHDTISAGLLRDILAHGKGALTRAGELTLPTLLLQAGGDTIVSTRAISRFADRAGENLTLKTWPEGRHELHNDLCRKEVFEQVSAFVAHHMTKDAAASLPDTQQP